MPSFTLHDLDRAFCHAGAKAATEGITVKALSLKLLVQSLGVVGLALALVGCAYHAPDAPTPIAPVASRAPFSVTLGSVAGIGPTAGSTTLTASVLNGGGVALPDVLVEFSTDVGTLSASAVMTIATGQAVSILTSAAGSTSAVTVTAGTLSTRLLVTTAAAVAAPPPPTPPVPLPDPTAPIQPLTVTLLATPRQAGTASDFSLATLPLSRATWSFGDNSAPVTTSNPFVSHTYAVGGSYTAGVTVTDTLGRSASASASVVIQAAPAPPAPPALNITLTCIPAMHGSSTPTACNVSVTYGSTPILPSAFTLVAWDFGDGHAPSSLLGSNIYAQAGTYTVVVTVGANTVDGSKTATTSKAVIIP